jgi:hypothetical protein
MANMASIDIFTLLDTLCSDMRIELAKFVDPFTCRYLTTLPNWSFVTDMRRLDTLGAREDAFEAACDMNLVHTPLAMKLFDGLSYNTQRFYLSSYCHKTVSKRINRRRTYHHCDCTKEGSIPRHASTFDLLESMAIKSDCVSEPVNYFDSPPYVVIQIPINRNISWAEEDLEDTIEESHHNIQIVLKSSEFYQVLRTRFTKEVHAIETAAKINSQTNPFEKQRMHLTWLNERRDATVSTFSECACGYHADLCAGFYKYMQDDFTDPYVNIAERLRSCHACTWFIMCFGNGVRFVQTGDTFEDCFRHYLDNMRYVTPIDAAIMAKDERLAVFAKHISTDSWPIIASFIDWALRYTQHDDY